MSDGSSGMAMVPSGLSTGRREAFEKRDVSKSRWEGKGVLEAVSGINGKISKALVGAEAEIANVDGRLIDVDGTKRKSNLGANAILAVSLANARALAASREIPLYEFLNDLSGSSKPSIPTPMVNILSGGLHAGGSNLMQDFLVIPIGAESYRMALDWIGSVYHTAKELLKDGGHSVLLADEGGFAPPFKKDEDALGFLERSVTKAGLQLGREMALAIDAASSRRYSKGKYHVSGDRSLDSSGMVNFVEKLTSDYHLISVEDGCAENDWGGWAELTGRLGSCVQLVGDDVFVTNPSLIREGATKGVANSVLIKLNQIGTLTETLKALESCRAVGYSPVVSARSGDTEDSFIADLAVGTAAGQIKIGSIARSERASKYNQLLRLEEKLGRGAEYAGRLPFKFLG